MNHVEIILLYCMKLLKRFDTFTYGVRKKFGVHRETSLHFDHEILHKLLKHSDLREAHS